jgi:hypothetical protein
MAVTQRQRTVVNPGRRRKLSPAQIKAGFGGKRRQSAAKVKRHKPAPRKNKARSAPKPKSSSHKKRTAPRKTRRATKANYGKLISFTLPKESQVATTTKKNRSRKNRSTSYKRKPMKANGHRRRTKRNPSMGDLGGLVSSAVFVIAGAVGSKYATQMVLGSSNTSFMGYFGNLVSAFVLSWGVKSFMKNEKAAAAVLSGGIVQVVLRLINDYTPFGQYTANIGMGDAGCAGMNAYMPQNFLTPQRLVDGMHSAQLQTFPSGGGMAGCCNLYSTTGGLYSAVA